jgi:phenylalanyl-tRNA synthetase alpha chain
MKMFKSEYCNIPSSIENKLNMKLHNQKNHPIEIMKNHIYDYFSKLNDYEFKTFDDLSPIVSVEDNFDKLLILPDHSSRRKSDTYYINEQQVLRTHTSAHQNELLKQGYTSFLVTGDVYRKDEIDSRHYPIFHQMEMLTIVNVNPEEELKRILSGLIEHLFPTCEYRFNKDYFPFTNPSFEIEVMYNNKWLEILGCGIVQPKILENNGIHKNAIAVGLGLDRLVMIFANIPDIRYLWSTHERFLNQYSNGKIVTFQPYSVISSQSRDVSFFIPNEKISSNQWLDENDFFELIREHSGEMMEEVSLTDCYYNKKLEKYSRTYRLSYSPIDPDMKDSAKFSALINKIQNDLRLILSKLDIVLR